MRKRAAPIHAVVVSLILASLACQAPFGQTTQEPTQPEGSSDIGTSVAATVAAVSTLTVQAVGAAVPTDTPQPPAASDTPEPSLTPTETMVPTDTLTPTPSAPTAYLTENTNCRKGPLAVYDLVATYLTGKVLNIIGQNAAGDYVYVVDPEPPGKQCWLWMRYVQVTGSVAQVPVFTPPPTPTPSYDWTANWNVWVNGTAGTMNITQNGSSISGTLTGSGLTYDIAGTVSAGGRKVSGQAKQGGSVEAEFTWTMLDNMDQFRGSYTTPPPGSVSGSWCGARNGAGMPSPCS
jgi:hypothetical protein